MKTTNKIPAEDPEHTDSPPAAEPDEQSSKAPISEEFQMRTLDHLKGANKHELDFVRSQLNEHEQKLREQDESDKPVSITDYPH